MGAALLASGDDWDAVKFPHAQFPKRKELGLIEQDKRSETLRYRDLPTVLATLLRIT